MSTQATRNSKVCKKEFDEATPGEFLINLHVISPKSKLGRNLEVYLVPEPT